MAWEMLNYKAHFKGLYMYFHGNKNTLVVGYNENFGKINTQVVNECNLQGGRKIYFFIKGNESEITISLHYADNDKYNKCMSIPIKSKAMELFYINFFARSYKSAPFMADVNSIIFSTAIENIGISLFEARFDDNPQKLFRQISYYALNEEFLKNNQKSLLQENYSVKSLYENQTEILNILDYSGTLLDKNLEEGEDMVEFLSQQKSLMDSYAKSVLDSMNDWITDTAQQFEIIEKDALGLLTDYQNFDLETEFAKTKDIIGNVKRKFGDNWKLFENFRLNVGKIRPNLEFLRKKGKNIAQFQKLIEKYKAGEWVQETKEFYGTSILLMAIGVGIIIMIALLAILKRLGSSQKIQTFS